ncbi:hypothetical protein IB292_02460 [Vibrio parahaemolyticus]|uniref:Uncharacterized protein n=1 Tax=Vibrio parahaemolyticus TaxID=670 RepID=A0A9Q3YG36_VIBPH|nr:hypothetical protein [Vibrio parahaemolyticus]MCC3803891.1 hypothetical protein [Vibrio parahaemolyticus]
MLNTSHWLTIQNPMPTDMANFFSNILDGKPWGNYHLVFGDEAMSQVPISIYVHKMEEELSSKSEFYQFCHLSLYEFAGTDSVREVKSYDTYLQQKQTEDSGPEDINSFAPYVDLHLDIGNVMKGVCHGRLKLISLRTFNDEEKQVYRQFGHMIALKELVVGEGE